jgi:methylglyoxal synthase
MSSPLGTPTVFPGTAPTLPESVVVPPANPLVASRSRQPHGRVAFITTPAYRDNRKAELETFVHRHLYELCNAFEVLCTGGTYKSVSEIISRTPAEADRSTIEQGTNFPIESDEDLARWRNTIKRGLREKRHSIQGMIEIANELVEGRLDAVIHLMQDSDMAGKPDSAVLRREALVHNVSIATDIHSAKSAIAAWNARLSKISPGTAIFPDRERPKTLPLEGLEPHHRILALVAHDGKKLDLCCFAVQYASQIFNDYDYVLATGTTGKWLKRFVLAAGHSQHEADRIRCCLSGPDGGDVQIAAAVVRRLCHKIIFFQDPFVSHAHHADIRLFEQSLLLSMAQAEDLHVQLATNPESARAALGF